MLTSRIVKLNSSPETTGPVIWWISRDQRADDNWALLAAQETAIRNRVSLVAVFCLVPEFIGASTFQYSFMIDGLRELEGKLSDYGIPFVLLAGDPEKAIPGFAGKIDAGAVFTDFNPLRISQNWKKKIADVLEIAFYEVDTHNIVPCRVASAKQEYGAYTIRPKIKRLLQEYLTEIPKCRRGVLPVKLKFKSNDWRSALGTVKADDSVKSMTWLKSGETAAAGKAC